MLSKKLRINFDRKIGESCEIQIGSGVLSSFGVFARRVFGKSTRKIVIVSNKKVFGLYGEEVAASLKKKGFAVSTFMMGDGEKYKDLKTLTRALEFFSRSGLTRTDGVIALGGGVAGDLAGFAAAVYLRGISCIQIPTTLLAMIDSSVGGKTAVNSSFGKNLIGAFHQPAGILADIKTLRTLPHRETTAGMCEAIKQAVLSGDPLFTQLTGFLQDYPLRKRPWFKNEHDFLARLQDLIDEQISFKAAIVAGDPFEETARRDNKSRKILNLGHTFAHALEKITDYRYLRHGEAVGYGIKFAAELSKKLEILDENELELLNDVVHRAGKLPPLNNIDSGKLYRAFQFDKKNLLGTLDWVLLAGIGNPRIISGRDIPVKSIKQAVKKILA